MNFSFIATDLFSHQTPVAVLFAFENERLSGPRAFTDLIGGLGKKEFSGASKQVLLLHPGARLQPRRLLLVGLGKKENVTTEIVRRAVGQATKQLRDAALTEAVVQVRDLTHLTAITEALILASYQFTRFRPDDERKPELEKVTFVLPREAALPRAKALVNRAAIMAESSNFTREIANLPGNVVYPAVLADYARKLAQQFKLKCTILDKRGLERGKFGGILAVGSGSQREPRLIVLEYKPRQTRTTKPIALVGKAITFDSGGISIKPSAKMEDMKFDKCGGVAVLGAMRAVALLKLPLHVIGIVASAENLPSATSYRPGDIVTSYKGRDKRGVTIEVLNTDAEGRIVLGDALVYARDRNPAAIIDLATLTGACVVALGEITAGLMGNDEALQQLIRTAGDVTGERVWPLPLSDDYKELIKSRVADHQNTGGREGGAITAAAFLARYVGDIPWAHLDIAGTAWSSKDLPYVEKGATGFGVRLLTQLLNDWK